MEICHTRALGIVELIGVLSTDRVATADDTMCHNPALDQIVHGFGALTGHKKHRFHQHFVQDVMYRFRMSIHYDKCAAYGGGHFRSA